MATNRLFGRARPRAALSLRKTRAVWPQKRRFDCGGSNTRAHAATSYLSARILLSQKKDLENPSPPPRRPPARTGQPGQGAAHGSFLPRPKGLTQQRSAPSAQPNNAAHCRLLTAQQKRVPTPGPREQPLATQMIPDNNTLMHAHPQSKHTCTHQNEQKHATQPPAARAAPLLFCVHSSAHSQANPHARLT